MKNRGGWLGDLDQAGKPRQAVQVLRKAKIMVRMLRFSAMSEIPPTSAIRLNLCAQRSGGMTRASSQAAMAAKIDSDP
jgi:hypothetical protein